MLVSTGNIDLPSEKMMVRTLVSNVNGVYSNSYLCHKTTAREGQSVRKWYLCVYQAGLPNVGETHVTV